MAELWGVAYGNKWQYRNIHFRTQEEARAWLASHLADVRNSYPGMRIQERSDQDSFEVVNIKKNGKPGVLREHGKVYRLARPCTFAFCQPCRDAIDKCGPDDLDCAGRV